MINHHYTDRVVAKHFNLPVSAIRRPTRKEAIILLRFAAILVAKNQLGYSLNKLKRAYGKKSHSTIHHAINEAGNLIDTNITFRQKYEAVMDELSHLAPELQADKQRYNLHYRLRRKQIRVSAKQKSISIIPDQAELISQNTQLRHLIKTHKYNIQFSLI